MKGWKFQAKEMNEGDGMMWADAAALDAAALPTALKVYRQIVSDMLRTAGDTNE